MKKRKSLYDDWKDNKRFWFWTTMIFASIFLLNLLTIIILTLFGIRFGLDYAPLSLVTTSFLAGGSGAMFLGCQEGR